MVGSNQTLDGHLRRRVERPNFDFHTGTSCLRASLVRLSARRAAKDSPQQVVDSWVVQINARMGCFDGFVDGIPLAGCLMSSSRSIVLYCFDTTSSSSVTIARCVLSVRVRAVRRRRRSYRRYRDVGVCGSIHE